VSRSQDSRAVASWSREYGSGVFAAPALIVRTRCPRVCARSSRQAAQSSRSPPCRGWWRSWAPQLPSPERRAFDGHRGAALRRTVFPRRVAYRTRPGPYISGSVTPSCSCTRETQLLQRPFWPENDDGWAAGGAVAAEVGRQLGGEWTARSVRTLAGTLRCGFDHG